MLKWLKREPEAKIPKLSFDPRVTVGDGLDPYANTRVKLGGPGELPAPIEMSFIDCPPGGVGPQEDHGVFEVLIVQAGTATLETSGAPEVLQTGDSCYVTPNVPHRITNRGSERLRVISITWSR